MDQVDQVSYNQLFELGASNEVFFEITLKTFALVVLELFVIVY